MLPNYWEKNFPVNNIEQPLILFATKILMRMIKMEVSDSTCEILCRLVFV